MMTRVQALDIAIANIADEEAISVLENIKTQISKKYVSSKPSKRQVENEAIKERILEVLSDEGKTVTEIMKSIGDKGLTNQRISALLRQMGDSVNKEVVKGKSLFTIK